MFLMLPAPPGLDSQNPTISYVYGGLKVAVTPAFSFREGKGGGVNAITTTLGGWKCRESRRGAPLQTRGVLSKGERNRSSDDLGNEFPGDIGQTHVPAVVIVGKPFMVYP